MQQRELRLLAHLLERGERGEDGAALPRGKLTLRWRADADLQILRGELPDLVQEPVAKAGKECRAARQHDFAEELLAQVEVRCDTMLKSKGRSDLYFLYFRNVSEQDSHLKLYFNMSAVPHSPLKIVSTRTR